MADLTSPMNMAAVMNPVRGLWVAVLVAMLGVLAGFSGGCDEKVSREVEQVKLAGKVFYLEVSNTEQTRFRGLSERTHIEPDGGMLFVFPDPTPGRPLQVQGFVMRDCPVQIDIIYADPAGKVVAMYEMKPEPPRTEAEKVLTAPFPNAPAWTHINQAYENRLKRYMSGEPAQFVIELKGGVLRDLQAAGLKVGDVLSLDVARLKRLAR